MHAVALRDRAGGEERLRLGPRLGEEVALAIGLQRVAALPVTVRRAHVRIAHVPPHLQVPAPRKRPNVRRHLVKVIEKGVYSLRVKRHPNDTHEHGLRGFEGRGVG